MNRLAAFLFFASALLGSPGCAHVQPIVNGGEHCAAVAGSATLDDVLPQVNAVIGCSAADPAEIPACVVSGIEALGKKFSKDLILCALEQIETGKLATPGDSTAGLKQRRAKAYLQAHGG